MNKVLIQLQKEFGERPISAEKFHALKQGETEINEDWFEYDEKDAVYYLTPEALDYKPAGPAEDEALGLGELEERIVEVLEQGKTVKWGKLAMAMWLFFLFIVIYTVIQTVL